MNRRGFLKFLGGAGVALATFSPARLLAVARVQVYEGIDTEGLRLAIERLFPTGVTYAFKAYEEFAWGRKDPLPPHMPPDDVRIYEAGSPEAVANAERLVAGLREEEIQRVVHQTYALGYIETPDAARNLRLRRAMFRSMYQTFAAMASRPENQGAVLVWRIKPTLATKNDFEDMGKSHELRIRASLRQTEWRERMQVKPWMAGAKPEGAPTPMVA